MTRRPTMILLLLLGLSLLTLAAWLTSVAVKAWVDVPRVLEAVKSSGRLTLDPQDMSPDFQGILLAVEDPGFFSHHGVDVTTPGSGWTTITQGLVKILFYDGFTPGAFRYRKIEQSVIALVFDRRVDKPTQLRLFVSTSPTSASTTVGKFSGSPTRRRRTSTRTSRP